MHSEYEILIGTLNIKKSKAFSAISVGLPTMFKKAIYPGDQVCTGEISETTLSYIYQKQMQQLEKKLFNMLQRGIGTIYQNR